jgi:DNA-binding transcriptional MerR regulator
MQPQVHLRSSIKKIRKTDTLDIGEVAKYSGLPVSTLRFYEERGLIRSSGRSGLRRLFTPPILEQLDFIALGRQAGFSLEEIAAMFSANGQIQIDRKQLLSKVSGVDNSIKQLILVREGLLHVAKCSAPRHLECPKFQRLLRIAGMNQARARRKN